MVAHNTNSSFHQFTDTITNSIEGTPMKLHEFDQSINCMSKYMPSEVKSEDKAYDYHLLMKCLGWWKEYLQMRRDRKIRKEEILAKMLTGVVFWDKLLLHKGFLGINKNWLLRKNFRLFKSYTNQRTCNFFLDQWKLALFTVNKRWDLIFQAMKHWRDNKIWVVFDALWEITIVNQNKRAGFILRATTKPWALYLITSMV